MENVVYETMLKRRAIRKFKNEQVSKEKIETLLKAAMSAPSGFNLQPWEFIVVDDENVLKELDKTFLFHVNPSPLAIILCGVKDHLPFEGDGYLFDLGFCCQNILLEAVELDLGACPCSGFDHDLLKKILDIPDNVIPVSFIKIGYPDEEKNPCTYYEEKAISYNKYDHNKNRVFKKRPVFKK